MEDGKKILVIDDEPDTLTYFSTVLEDNGYRVITAKNGEEGLNKAINDQPDLITLDITMPEMSGVKFYRRIKEAESLKSVPILIITGISDDFKSFISSRSQVPPPDGYLSKPVEEAELLALVNKLI